ncbi:MAG: hypothetical protein F4Y57_13355 [Acidobacteria bacterium]|nr:hypothetical protein [Acidobacteriota bacterium]
MKLKLTKREAKLLSEALPMILDPNDPEVLKKAGKQNREGKGGPKNTLPILVDSYPTVLGTMKAFWWNGGLHIVPGGRGEEQALNMVLDGLGIVVHDDDPDIIRQLRACLGL